MKCKVGDLARILRCDVESNRGKFVYVVSHADEYSRLKGNDWFVELASGGLFDGPRGAFQTGSIPDADLQPIRDQPGQDETLAWAGVPAQTVRRDGVAA